MNVRAYKKPLPVDVDGPSVDGEYLARAEQLLGLLQRRLLRPMVRGGPKSELSMTQYHALSLLAARGSTSVSELKDALGIAQSSASELVAKLSREGLVERHAASNDRRLTVVVALPKGLRLIRRLRENAGQNLDVLRGVHGPQVLQELMDALARAVVLTAPLEHPTFARAATARAAIADVASPDAEAVDLQPSDDPREMANLPSVEDAVDVEAVEFEAVDVEEHEVTLRR